MKRGRTLGLSLVFVVALSFGMIIGCGGDQVEKICIDIDGDGYGNNCDLGIDCDGFDPNNWAKCDTCQDSDLDGWYINCDRYLTINGLDCNDSDASINPGAAEITCNGVDNDCDPATLDDPDGDNDTWDVCGAGDPVNPDGKDPADCNDSDDSINPGATEICGDGIDQNCDGSLICDGGTVDSDGDEYGSIASGGTDCNDSDDSINPGAAEICGDGADQDCDGSLICDGGTVDSDGDEYASIAFGGTDCDDGDASINPGAAEITCDGMDNDCSAATLDAPDGDIDTWDVCGAGDSVNPDGKDPADCNDSDDSINPGAAEICGDGTDQDCDGSLICDGGTVDSDGDEYASIAFGGTDCDDGDASVNPGAAEIPFNERDDNCDGDYYPDVISVSHRDTTGQSSGVYVTGGYAYVADCDNGLAIIDVSDPANPGTPLYRDTTGQSYGVYVTGGYAYVADYDSGLAIIDVSDPANPGTPLYRDTSGRSWGVYVTGDYAYVADWESGLAIIDVSDPANPGTPLYRDTSGQSYGVYVTGGYAYVADWDNGLEIFKIW